MNINTLLNASTEAVAGNVALETWCQDNYGRSVSVYANFDERNPPGEENCPAVAIYPADKGYGGAVFSDGIEFIVMLHDENVRTHVGFTNIMEYVGVQNIETFRQRVLSAIAGVIALTDSTRIDSVAVEYDSITYFPVILAICALDVQTPYVIGSGSPFVNE